MSFDFVDYKKDFPLLMQQDVAYLDSAATTQHPTQVLNAVVNYYTKENANPHRGVYELAMRATDAHEGARHTVAQFFNAADDEIVFTQNTTESLNLIAYSYGMNFLHEGDEIVVSVAEHHSNMVPWQRVAKATGAKLVYMYPGENGRLTTEELDKKITPRTKVVAVAMVSNVLGLRAPVEEIVKRAHAVGAVVVLDCAQSAPHTPVDVKKLDVDFAACSAHKLYAPMGVGALYARAELLEVIGKLRREIPGITLRTTLIAGFPGETEEQFEDLCNFVKEVKFDRLGCFAYSAEENTVAARMDGQIEQEVKDKRAELVMQIQTGIMAQKQAEKVGQTVRVLCDGIDEESGLYLCRTTGDAPEVDGNVCVSSEEPLYPGQFYDVLVDDSDLYDLYGTVVK